MLDNCSRDANITAMFKRLAIFLVCLLLFSFLVEAFHFHDNGDDHADCPVCVAHHQQSDSAYTPPPFEIQRDVAETVYSRPVPAVVSKVFFTPANNRAPPA